MFTETYVNADNSITRWNFAFTHDWHGFIYPSHWGAFQQDAPRPVAQQHPLAEWFVYRQVFNKDTWAETSGYVFENEATREEFESTVFDHGFECFFEQTIGGAWIVNVEHYGDTSHWGIH